MARKPAGIQFLRANRAPAKMIFLQVHFRWTSVVVGSRAGGSGAVKPRGHCNRPHSPVRRSRARSTAPTGPGDRSVLPARADLGGMTPGRSASRPSQPGHLQMALSGRLRVAPTGVADGGCETGPCHRSARGLARVRADMAAGAAASPGMQRVGAACGAARAGAIDGAGAGVVSSGEARQEGLPGTPRARRTGPAARAGPP